MVKELGKEKKFQKKDIDNEYPTWPWGDYKFQDAKFFEDVKKLLALKLDPKRNITYAHEIIVAIAKVFSNVQKFTITNPLLSND